MERVRTLLTLLPEPMLLLSSKGEILAVNPAFTRLLGGDQEVWQGKSIFDLTTSSRETVQRYLRTCARTRQMVPGALNLASCEGEPLAVRCEGALVTPPSGDSEAQLLLRFRRRWEASRQFTLLNQKLEQLSREVLQHKRLERSLRASEQHFRSLSACSPVGIFVADSTGMCMYTNQTCQAIVGCTYEDALGQGWLDFVHPEDHDEVLRRWWAYIRGEEPLSSQFRFENPTLGVRWVHVRAAPLDSEDQPGHHVGTVEDITDRRRTEETLRAREKALRHQSRVTRTITSNASAALFMLDESGKCTFMNPSAEALTGYSLVEFRGKPFHDMVHYLDADGNPCSAVDCPLHGTQAGDAPIRDHEDILVRKDGSSLPVKYSSSPILDDGIVRGTVIEIRDITDEKRIAEEREQLLHLEQQARIEAEEANRMKDEFLAAVSHELRTPLTSIIGWLHLLRQRREDEVRFTRALETVERNARLQNQLIEDLLDVSRIVTGNLRLEMAPVALGSCVEAALEAVRPAAEAKGIHIESRVPAGSYLVRGDQARLQQIAWNLLSNAVKFTPQGGSVAVSITMHEAEYEMVVSDTGVGISPAYLPHIFDRFQQVDGTTTREYGGLGLGLSIVRHLVESHGGYVWAESAGAEQGASLFVRLPVLADHRRNGRDLGNQDRLQTQTVPGPREQQRLLADLTVLVVDDDEDTRDFLALMLEQWGVTVHRTGSASDEAFDLLNEIQPDLLISDLAMPGEDGYSLIRRIRALPLEEGGGVPAIALTALTREEDRWRALQAGYQLHIGKPVDPDELKRAVGNLAMWTRSCLSA